VEILHAVTSSRLSRWPKVLCTLTGDLEGAEQASRLEISLPSRKLAILRVTLDDTQKAALHQLARQPVGRVSECAHFVLLSAQGHSAPRIATLLGYDAATVRHWLKGYLRHGLPGLYDAPCSGRPPKDKLLTGMVQAQASQSPASYGYLQACWTVALLLGHLRERLPISIGATTLRQALRRAGFRWTRPKCVLPRKPDPLAEEKRQRLAQALADPQATVLAEDECDLHLLAVLRAMWQRVGQQRPILAPSQNRKRGAPGRRWTWPRWCARRANPTPRAPSRPASTSGWICPRCR
jgi:transposase